MGGSRPRPRRVGRSLGWSSVRVIDEPARRDDIAQMLRAAGVPSEPDVLVIDIDSDDLGVLRSVFSAFRPRLVVEYNAAFSPLAIWSMNPARLTAWDGTFRHGASLGALNEAAVFAGYTLVHCDSSGVNAFFVRVRPAANLFTMAGKIASQYRVASFTAHPFGHPRSRGALAPMEPLQIEQLQKVTIAARSGLVGQLAPREIFDVLVRISNASDRVLTSGAPNAVHLSARWIDGEREYPTTTPPELHFPVQSHQDARPRPDYGSSLLRNQVRSHFV